MEPRYPFLLNSGAEVVDDRVTSFGETPEQYQQLLSAPLLFAATGLGVLRFSGDSVIKMLQGQVTCDMEQIAERGFLPGAHCTPKGRMIANFWLLQDQADILMILPAQRVDAILKSLGKFAPFFKVQVTREDDLLILAAANKQSNDQATLSFNPLPGLTLFACEKNSAEELWEKLSQNFQPAGEHLWNLLLICHGFGWVLDASDQEFIPQMINLQAIGGISFRKGCYTGQEIVARMKYLGKLKRRMYLIEFKGQVPPAANEACFIPGKTQGVGNIVMAERSGTGTIKALAVLTEPAAQSEQLQFGEGEAVKITQLPLPYSLEE